MRVSNPYANKSGDVKISVALTLGEVAQYIHVLGASRQVSVSFDAEHFTAAIAPALAKITPAAAEQTHAAGVSVDPVRESRKRVPRAPKPPAEAAPTFDATTIASAIEAAVSAALDARDRAATRNASLAKARAAKSAKRDAQIAAQIAKTS